MLELFEAILQTVIHGAVVYFVVLQINRNWASMIKFFVVIMICTQIIDAWNSTVQPICDFFSSVSNFINRN